MNFDNPVDALKGILDSAKNENSKWVCDRCNGEFDNIAIFMREGKEVHACDPCHEEITKLPDPLWVLDRVEEALNLLKDRKASKAREVLEYILE